MQLQMQQMQIRSISVVRQFVRKDLKKRSLVYYSVLAVCLGSVGGAWWVEPCCLPSHLENIGTSEGSLVPCHINNTY